MTPEEVAYLIKQMESCLGKVLLKTLTHLLSEKHLYQSASLSQDTNAFAKEPWNDLRTTLQKQECYRFESELKPEVWSQNYEYVLRNRYWKFQAEHPMPALDSSSKGLRGGPKQISLTLKSIELDCTHCKSKKAFNSVEVLESEVTSADPVLQNWSLTYECQICRTERTTFLLHREDLKLQICGRFPIELISIPKYIPSSQSNHFSRAIIAANTGYVLAGIFLLRVFVEQYWRSLPTIREMPPRATGEEMGDMYQQTLKDLPTSTFPSLKDVYSILSEAMHSANEELEVFNKCQDKIEAHFATLAQFKANAGLLEKKRSAENA